MIHTARYLAPGEKVGSGTRVELEALLDMAQPGWRAAASRRVPLAPRRATVMHALPRGVGGRAEGSPPDGRGGPSPTCGSAATGSATRGCSSTRASSPRNARPSRLASPAVAA